MHLSNLIGCNKAEWKLIYQQYLYPNFAYYQFFSNKYYSLGKELFWKALKKV